MKFSVNTDINSTRDIRLHFSGDPDYLDLGFF